jgi:hypothetical protein
MVFKYLFLLLFFSFKLAYSNIIYDKNEISINKIELEEYINLYEDNYFIEPSKNIAIKNIVLLKKTIKYLQKNNPLYIEQLDQELKIKFGLEIFQSEMKRDFLRYLNIKNEFIINYINKNFDAKELEIIFSSLADLKLPISKNGCLTIEKLTDLKKNSYFINSFYENLNNNSQNYKAKINNEIYSVCISNNMFNKIEKIIVIHVENKIKDDFDFFIYGKSY